MSIAFAPSAAPPTAVRLTTLWSAVVKEWRLVAAVAAAITLASIAIAIFAPAQYRATTILAPPAQSQGSGALGALAGQFGGLADLAGIDLNGHQSIDETLAILDSDEFLERF